MFNLSSSAPHTSTHAIELFFEKIHKIRNVEYPVAPDPASNTKSNFAFDSIRFEVVYSDHRNIPNCRFSGIVERSAVGENQNSPFDSMALH